MIHSIMIMILKWWWSVHWKIILGDTSYCTTYHWAVVYCWSCYWWIVSLAHWMVTTLWMRCRLSYWIIVSWLLWIWWLWICLARSSSDIIFLSTTMYTSELSWRSFMVIIIITLIIITVVNCVCRIQVTRIWWWLNMILLVRTLTKLIKNWSRSFSVNCWNLCHDLTILCFYTLYASVTTTCLIRTNLRIILVFIIYIFSCRRGAKQVELLRLIIMDPVLFKCYG